MEIVKSKYDKLDQIVPYVKDKAIRVIKELELKGIYVLVYSTLRSYSEQAILYRQGHSKLEIDIKKEKLISLGRKDLASVLDSVGPQNGKLVTNAGPGESMHNYALAFDFVPYNKDGSLGWENTKAYSECMKAFRDSGFECGGDWKGKLVDKPHIQLNEGLSVRELLEGKRPTFYPSDFKLKLN